MGRDPQGPDEGKINIQAGEFVFPKDVVAHVGPAVFQALLKALRARVALKTKAKSRKPQPRANRKTIFGEVRV